MAVQRVLRRRQGYWQQSEDPADPRLTVEPDVPVTVTADDYFAGRDPALRAALGDLP